MTSFTEDLKTLDIDKTTEWLQITADVLKTYFESDKTIEKTAATWRESIQSNLWKLNPKDKENLCNAIDDYLSNKLTVISNDGMVCPAVNIINACKTYEEAKEKVNKKDNEGKQINICSALLSCHSFLTKGARLTYNKAQAYSEQFCKWSEATTTIADAKAEEKAIKEALEQAQKDLDAKNLAEKKAILEKKQKEYKIAWDNVMDKQEIYNNIPKRKKNEREKAKKELDTAQEKLKKINEELEKAKKELYEVQKATLK